MSVFGGAQAVAGVAGPVPVVGGDLPGQGVGRTDDPPGQHLTPLSFAASGQNAGHGLRVGWTIWTQANAFVNGFGWVINPQNIDRQPAQRNGMMATQDHFYVDDFGPGSTTIVVTQLVASGGSIAQQGSAPGSGDQSYYTARGDVQRFMDLIYLPLTTQPGRYICRFHDNNYDPASGYKGERIYFPSQPLDVQRDVNQNNVWRVQITMNSLETRADGSADSTPQSTTATNGQTLKWYRVLGYQTLHGLARKLAGKSPTQARTEGILAAILAFNPTLAGPRTIEVAGGGGELLLAAYQLGAGELILIPA